MRVFAHPFRFGADRRIVTVEQGDDEHAAQQLAILLGTRLRERPLLPDYGTRDQAFSGVDPTEILAAVGVWVPDVAVQDLQVTASSDAVTDVTISFTVGESADAVA